MQTMNDSDLLAKPDVRNFVERYRRELRSVASKGSFAERERAMLTISNEVTRGALEDELSEMAAGYGAEVLIHGVAYRRHEPGTVTYHSLCGGLVVVRETYREVGVRNGPTVVPLELEAGLIERATPAMSFNVAHGFALHDMRLQEQSLHAAHRVPPSRTTLERIANRIGNAAVEEAPRIERQLRRAERVPEEAHAISIGLDRTAVAMLEPRPADAPPKPAPKRTKPRVRSAPPPTDIHWRMAYVGTVSLVNAEGEALLTRRYAAPACDDPRELVTQMTADVRAALERKPTLQVGIVQDGAPEMWNRTREGVEQLKTEGLIATWYEGIDRYHLSERVANALNLFDMNERERARLVNDWTERFDCDDSTIDTIERYLRRRHGELTTEKQQKLWEHLTYMRNNKDRMRYATLRDAGLPVGSGVTESAARTLVGQRAKGRGRRWRKANLRGALTLRAMLHSERFQRFWSRFTRRYTSEVDAA